MKSAARLFYLSVFALWTPQVKCQNPGSSSTSASSSSSQDACAISPQAIVGDACASYSTLEQLNSAVKPVLDDLVQTTDFFSHYRLNLFHKKCPFWNDENGMCGNVACAVETLDNEEDIPLAWRASELGKLEGPRARHPGKSVQRQELQRPLRGGLGEHVGESCVVEYDDECDDRDYCVPEDESSTSKGDYVSLLRNPERFTGYAGDGAKQVWDAIYRENCFQRSSFPNSADLGQGMTPRNPAAMDFRAIIEAAGRQQALAKQREQNPNTPFVAKTGLEFEDDCLEKRVFYRVISGMHASISTHLCWNFLNQTTGQWHPNLGCYMGRLHKHPERISNLYFNYALLTRAIAKIGPYLEDYSYCLGDRNQDEVTRAKVRAVTEKVISVPPTLDESLMFKNGEGPSLKEDFRNRFRNVSRLMDCVGCDKCRLWGKLQTAGYGTALKILFEFDNNEQPEIPVLKRTELVALFNTYARLGNSMYAITQFREMAQKAQSGANQASQAASASSISSAASMSSVASAPPSASAQSSASSSSSPETGPSKAVENAEAKREEKTEQQDDTDNENSTISEDFNAELANVLKVLKFVLKSWVSFPVAFYHIARSELRRLWQFYIGLPVEPRSWSFSFPRVDEL